MESGLEGRNNYEKRDGFFKVHIESQWSPA